MNRLICAFQTTLACSFFLLTSSDNFAQAKLQSPQMELRQNEEYNAEQFAASKPAVGEQAPNLELKTLDGKPVSLTDYLGKKIVVIKAGYT